MFAIVGSNETGRVRRRKRERERERETPLLPGTIQRGYAACAYASKLSFYLISAAAATLSRRLAREPTFYSLLPSRSGYAPPPSPVPRVSLARTSTLSLHLLYFVFPLLRLPVPLSSSFSLSFFLIPIFLSSSYLPFATSFFFPDPVSFFHQRPLVSSALPPQDLRRI